MYTPTNGYTKATIIETLKRHVRDARCMDEDGVCLYRHPEDPTWSCAVGAFIPRDLVGEEWGCPGGVSTLLDAAPDLQERMPLEVEALQQLQSIHDATEPYESALGRCLLWVEENVK